LKHLYSSFSEITDGDLEENDKKIKNCDPNQPTKILIDQVETGMEFASAGGSKYTPNQIVTFSYNLISKTGMFAEAFREWCKKPEVKKM